jgi:hypothetical protein
MFCIYIYLEKCLAISSTVLTKFSLTVSYTSRTLVVVEVDVVSSLELTSILDYFMRIKDLVTAEELRFY